jgi:hypothetical protein
MDRKLRLVSPRAAWAVLAVSALLWSVAAFGLLKSPSVTSPLIVLLWLYMVLAAVLAAAGTTLVGAAALFLGRPGPGIPAQQRDAPTARTSQSAWLGRDYGRTG